MNSPRGNILLLIAVLISTNHSLYAQKNKSNPLDSSLTANSDEWKVKLHKGLGMGKPEFGPYAVLSLDKLDSPKINKITTEGSYSGVELTSKGWDWDFSKYHMIEKRKVYKMSTSAIASLFALMTIIKIN